MAIADKEKAIQCHAKLFKTVENLLNAGLMTEEDVAAYIEHDVLPQYVYKHKDKHWAAAYMLIEALLSATSRAVGKPIVKDEPVEQPSQDALPDFAKGKVSPREDARPANVSS